MNKIFTLEKKKILSILNIITLSFVIFFISSSVQAEISFSNIQISNLKNGRADITWRTNEETKGDIYYGLDENNLDRYMGYSLFKKYHESILSGLEKDKTYYYKIVATNQFGENFETFLNSFSTDNMEDTVRPYFENSEILQITNNAVALRWSTNEETRAEIKYGENSDNPNHSTWFGSYDEKHDFFIYNLEIGTQYYLQIIAEDESGNKKTKALNFSTYNSTEDYSELEIFNVRPTTVNNYLVTERTATINWETNLIAKGVVYYGEFSENYNKSIDISSSRELRHQVTITDLIPNTKYYYKIKAHDSLYGRSIETGEKMFRTNSLANDFLIGSLIKGSGPKVYVVKDNSQIAWIENEEVFTGYNYQWSWIKTIGEADLAQYEEVDSISQVGCHPDGTLIKYADNSAVYMIEDCRKRPFYTGKAFEDRGYNWDRIITLPEDKGYHQGVNIY